MPLKSEITLSTCTELYSKLKCMHFLMILSKAIEIKETRVC
jgi:hypothetical protein